MPLLIYEVEVISFRLRYMGFPCKVNEMLRGFTTAPEQIIRQLELLS